MSDYRSEFSIRRLWIIFAASHGGHVRRLAVFRRPNLSRRSRRSRAPCERRRARSSTPARRSSAARTCGSRWAACSKARSGATAAMSRPTGARTGCTARRLPCATALPAPGRARRFDALPEPDQARFGAILKHEMRTNTYDPQTADIIVSDQRAAAIAATAAHYSDLFTNRTPADQQLRELYAMPQNAVLSADEAHALTAFIFWTAWATDDRSARRHHHLHQQLAARAAGRQHADGRRSSCGPSSRSSCCSAGSARWSGITPVNSTSGAAISSRPKASRQPTLLAQRHDHAVDAGDRQILLRRHRAVPCPGAARHRHRTLCGRRAGPLRPADGRVLPLRGHPHLAHPAGGAVDRHRLARHRPLRRAAARRTRAEIPALRASTSCSSACWSSSSGRSPANGSAINRHMAVRHAELLVRPPGL